MSSADLFANDHVDSLAKAVAKKYAPSIAERERIVSTSQLVEDVARWIGQVTVLANHFPCTREDGTKVVLRDADAKKRRPKLACISLALGKQKRKLGPASPDSITSLSVSRPSAEFFTYGASRGAPARKCRRVSHKGIVDRESASFHEHCRASRDLRGQPAPPPISAADRLQAIRGRVLAKKGNCSGAPA